jgi:hypothetical protein
MLTHSSILWVGGSSIGKMVHATKGSGSAAKLAEKANSSCQTETLTKVSGRMTRHQALVVLFPKRNDTLASGKTTFIMARVKNSGKTDPVTPVPSLQVKRTAMVFINGRTKLHMKVVG